MRDRGWGPVRSTVAEPSVPGARLPGAPEAGSVGPAGAHTAPQLARARLVLRPVVGWVHADDGLCALEHALVGRAILVFACLLARGEICVGALVPAAHTRGGVGGCCTAASGCCRCSPTSARRLFPPGAREAYQEILPSPSAFQAMSHMPSPTSRLHAGRGGEGRASRGRGRASASQPALGGPIGGRASSCACLPCVAAPAGPAVCPLPLAPAAGCLASSAPSWRRPSKSSPP